MGFQYLSDDAQLRSLIFWLMGSFARAEWETVIPAGFIILSVEIDTSSAQIFTRQTKALDRLQLGESQAFHLGVNVRKLQRFIILLTAVSVGVGVALSGIIGFVGLVVPHLIWKRLTLKESPTQSWFQPLSNLGANVDDLCNELLGVSAASRTLIGSPIELRRSAQNDWRIFRIVTSAIGYIVSLREAAHGIFFFGLSHEQSTNVSQSNKYIGSKK